MGTDIKKFAVDYYSQKITEIVSEDHPLRVFIGWDQSEAESADVLKYSLLKYSTIPLDVHLLKTQVLKDVFGYSPNDDRPASTDFTYTRFLVPWLCGYKGFALFMDCDIICLRDIKGLLEYAAGDFGFSKRAVWCVPHIFIPTTDSKMDGKPQKAYFRKLWSSVMLMNCDELDCWGKDIVEEHSPSWLHGFETFDPSAIGILPRRFNEVDRVREIRYCSITLSGTHATTLVSTRTRSIISI